MNIRHKQRHRPAFGDFPGFVQVALRAVGAGASAGEPPLPGAGEEAAHEERDGAGSAQAGNGLVDLGILIFDFRLVEDRRVERGAAQREVFEGDVEEPVVALGNRERLHRALRDVAAVFNVAFRSAKGAFFRGAKDDNLPRRPFGCGEEQVAILEARRGIQQRVGGLALGLHLLGLAEERLRLGPAARLVQGVGMGRARSHPPKRIAAAVGVRHAPRGVPHRPGHLAQRLLQLAKVVNADCGKSQIVLLDEILQPSPYRIEGLGQPAQGAQAKTCFVQQACFSGIR